MEERRFDDLTRVLGRATSRRGVLKGVLGVALAGVFASRQRPATVDAASKCADATSDPKAIRICEQGARKTFSNRMKFCRNEGTSGFQNGGIGALFGCTLGAELVLRDQLRACRTDGVCPTGNFCCGNQCCPAEEVCCSGRDSGTRVDSCVDLQTNAANCGFCWNQCDNGEICQQGNCVCPPETQTCGGTFNTACCAPDEECSTGFFGVARCTKRCAACEIYDPNDAETPCKPVQCDTCQECDGKTGQCVDTANGTACGSGLVCCGGQCQADSEECNGNGKGGLTCPECQVDDGNGNCVPGDDGGACSTCGICSSGLCVPDSNRTCPTCQTCSAKGDCTAVTDETSCGDNQVCCTGQCRTGTTCNTCPYPDDQHQCPQVGSSTQLCCDNGTPCCADYGGTGICGPLGGVCCDVGTQSLCGTQTLVCCDLATEDCSSPDGGATGQCCPKGERVVSDGSCCTEINICEGDTSICCGASEVCSHIDTTNQPVCCPQGEQAITDGSCCQTDQICATNSSSICCPSGLKCAQDVLGQIAACCASQSAASDGTCCTDDEITALCADNVSVCCDIGAENVCCADHGGAM